MFSWLSRKAPNSAAHKSASRAAAKGEVVANYQLQLLKLQADQASNAATRAFKAVERRTSYVERNPTNHLAVKQLNKLISEAKAAEMKALIATNKLNQVASKRYLHRQNNSAETAAHFTPEEAYLLGLPSSNTSSNNIKYNKLLADLNSNSIDKIIESSKKPKSNANELAELFPTRKGGRRSRKLKKTRHPRY